MASKPGILTDWPWKSLGSFKYGILVPWVVHSIYSYSVKGAEERDFTSLLQVPFMLSRIIHNQIWITLSRYRTAKGDNLIVVDKGIEFDQVDRESNWDDQIIMTTFLYCIVNITHAGASRLPLWRTDGVILTILLHMGPVENLYYWFHRALHHHYLYSRYHSHHHSSIVTQPISSVIHPFAEMIVYMLLFAIPLYTLVLTGTASLAAVFGYVTYIDFMNNMGHCNFELVPSWIFTIFPPLKYLMYTPSFHSLHHTQFRTNYSLFMPFYDYMYGTMDKSSDLLYQASRNKIEETPDVVHLTHLTTLQSIYHLRIGFGSLASKPFKYNWFIWMMWPFTCLSFIFTWFFDCKTFISEKHTFGKLIIQSWVLPKYNIQFSSNSQKETINSLIEEAIIEADSKGVKVLSLGLLNQDGELNGNGEFYIKRNPSLKIKVVDGSSLALAVVLNNIPNQTTQVLLRGKISKIARALTLALCQRGIQVATLSEDKYKKLKVDDPSAANNLVLTESYHHKIWVVGEGFNKEDEQLKAPKGTIFIPFSKFPMKKIRKDCYYLTTPAMMTPPSLRNQHSCEIWLPRRAMSAWRVAGIVHALEDWNVNECGCHTITMSSVHKVWEASLRHGFRPFQFSPNPNPNPNPIN